MSPEENLARIIIGAAAFTAMMLAVYLVGAGHGRPQPLPGPTWKHSVAFRLQQGRRP